MIATGVEAAIEPVEEGEAVMPPDTPAALEEEVDAGVWPLLVTKVGVMRVARIGNVWRLGCSGVVEGAAVDQPSEAIVRFAPAKFGRLRRPLISLWWSGGPGTRALEIWDKLGDAAKIGIPSAPRSERTGDGLAEHNQHEARGLGLRF